MLAKSMPAEDTLFIIGNCQSCYLTTDCSGAAIADQDNIRGCCVDTDDGLAWGSPGSCQICNGMINFIYPSYTQTLAQLLAI